MTTSTDIKGTYVFQVTLHDYTIRYGDELNAHLERIKGALQESARNMPEGMDITIEFSELHQ